MKIVIDSAIPFITDRFSQDVEVTYLPGTKFTNKDVKDADALIIRTRTVCDEKLLKDSNVKLIASATIGMDHIDKKWCEKNGIVAKNAPGCNAPGVAQYVFASLLNSGFDPTKDTLGIIGHGSVGGTVAAWSDSMGIKTLVNDPPRKIAGYKDKDYVALDYLLKNSDAITLHVPFIKSGDFPTLNLIGSRELNLIKEGGILINSSRGGVVDEKALKEMIKKTRLRYIVDVWENEPIIDNELAELSFISTPHIAGYSEEGKKRATRMALESVSSFFDIPVNLEGLECKPLHDSIDAELIMASYNPFKDSESLKKDICAFETLRNDYKYRHEPLNYKRDHP